MDIVKYIFPGTPIYNLSVVPGKNGKILRAAGSSGQIIKKTNKLAKIRLKSVTIQSFSTR